MPRLHHGVDIVQIDRIERMLETHGDRFVQRCFNPEEAAYAEAGNAKRAERYAARFACKEAVLKALGTGWRGGIRWRDIEVTRTADGEPGVRLSGRCHQLATEKGIRQWVVSLSHGGDYAIASVVAAVWD